MRHEARAKQIADQIIGHSFYRDESSERKLLEMLTLNFREVAAREREACALVAEEYLDASSMRNNSNPPAHLPYPVTNVTAFRIATAILARGDA